MRAGDRAWIILGCGVVAWELRCPEGELLSEAADRWVEHHPWLVRAVAFMLAAHVSNSVNPRYDLIHQLFRLRNHRRAAEP